MVRTRQYVAYRNVRAVYVRKPRMLASTGTMTMRCITPALTQVALTLFPRPSFLSARINSFSAWLVQWTTGVGYPSPTRYLVSRRMRTNLAHVSPICIYMNRRGLRDWNKFGRLSEPGNLYGHTSNRRACLYRYAYTYVRGRNRLPRARNRGVL